MGRTKVVEDSHGPSKNLALMRMVLQVALKRLSSMSSIKGQRVRCVNAIMQMAPSSPAVLQRVIEPKQSGQDLQCLMIQMDLRRKSLALHN